METFELSNELIEKVSQLISKRKNSEIKKIVDGFHYADLAEIIDELDENQRIYLIKLIDSDKTSDVLTELDEDVREKILKTLSPKEIAGEIKEMDSDDAADILDELTDDRKEKVISLIKDDNIGSFSALCSDFFVIPNAVNLADLKLWSLLKNSVSVGLAPGQPPST